jgi:hypothetical protein
MDDRVQFSQAGYTNADPVDDSAESPQPRSALVTVSSSCPEAGYVDADPVDDSAESPRPSLPAVRTRDSTDSRSTTTAK